MREGGIGDGDVVAGGVGEHYQRERTHRCCRRSPSLQHRAHLSCLLLCNLARCFPLVCYSPLLCTSTQVRVLLFEDKHDLAIPQTEFESYINVAAWLKQYM